MRLIKLVPLLILIGGGAIVGYGLWQRQKSPPTVLATGTFEFKDKLGTSLVFPSRRVSVAGFETSEIRLPNGTWIDCRADCAQTIRDQHVEFWDAQQMKR